MNKRTELLSNALAPIPCNNVWQTLTKIPSHEFVDYYFKENEETDEIVINPQNFHELLNIIISSSHDFLICESTQVSDVDWGLLQKQLALKINQEELWFLFYLHVSELNKRYFVYKAIECIGDRPH